MKARRFLFMSRYFLLDYKSFKDVSNICYYIIGKVYLNLELKDMIIENYYYREKQDLNKKLENKLQRKNDKEKVKKI